MDTASTSNNAGKICSLCNKNISKYCCPRCDALYCSVECYKSEKHLECSEDFYRECVNEELAGNQIDNESRQKMINILNKMRKQDMENQPSIDEILQDLDESELENDGDSEIDSDDNEYVDLKDRIDGLDLNDADKIWNVLTEDERNEFAALVNKGDVDKIIEHWEPWWLFTHKPKLIESVDVKSSKTLQEEALAKCPPLKSVPKLSELTSVMPSPAIKFNIINILASYVFIARYFNGEIEPMEGVHCLLEICANLNTNANFDDPQVAIESVAQKCIQSKLIETDEDSLNIMKHDTLLILNGPSEENKSYYCKAALSHIHELLVTVRSLIKSQKPIHKSEVPQNEFMKMFPDHTMEHLSALEISKVKKCIKKIEYYLSYIESYGIVTQ